VASRPGSKLTYETSWQSKASHKQAENTDQDDWESHCLFLSLMFELKTTPICSYIILSSYAKSNSQRLPCSSLAHYWCRKHAPSWIVTQSHRRQIKRSSSLAPPLDWVSTYHERSAAQTQQPSNWTKPGLVRTRVKLMSWAVWIFHRPWKLIHFERDRSMPPVANRTRHAAVRGTLAVHRRSRVEINVLFSF
jgi:hypothetical protein